MTLIANDVYAFGRPAVEYQVIDAQKQARTVRDVPLYWERPRTPPAVSVKDMAAASERMWAEQDMAMFG